MPGNLFFALNASAGFKTCIAVQAAEPSKARQSQS